MGRENMSSLHGNIVVLGRMGVLIVGPSGSGKTQLSRLLIKRWKARGFYACWVADDRFLIQSAGELVMAKPPAVLQGRAELRGYGIEDIEFQNRAILDQVVRLVPEKEIERMPMDRDYKPAPDFPVLPMMLAPCNEPNHAADLVEAQMRKIAV